MTRDRRAVRAVYREMYYYGRALSSRGVITDPYYRKKTEPPEWTHASERPISDKRILDPYRWAQRVRKRVKPRKRRPRPADLAALRIICEEFLGLHSPVDIIQAILDTTDETQVADRLKAALKADA